MAVQTLEPCGSTLQGCQLSASYHHRLSDSSFQNSSSSCELLSSASTPVRLVGCPEIFICESIFAGSTVVLLLGKWLACVNLQRFVGIQLRRPSSLGHRSFKIRCRLLLAESGPTAIRYWSSSLRWERNKCRVLLTHGNAVS